MQVTTPTIVVVGSNHEYAPVEVREQLAFAGDYLVQGLDALNRKVPEGFILSTCNRTEIYATGDDPQKIEDDIFEFLREQHSIPEEVLRRASYVLSGTQAVDHLFRVASGINSMVLGEPQILTQIREALDHARAQETVGPMLQRLTLDALRVGKRARTETDISRNRVSIAHAAVDLAGQELGSLQGRAVTILGAGKMAILAAKLLRARGVAEITIVNRSVDRARQLAESIDGIALPLSALEDAIASAELVVGAVLSDSPVIRRAHVASRLRPLLMIDLSVPRVIHSEVADVDMVTVRDVDALDAIAEENRRRYSSEVEKVEALVCDASRDYAGWLRSRRGANAIMSLRSCADAVKESELEKALRRLQHLSPRDQNVVRALASGLTNKLLYHPVQELRTNESVDQREAILRAFGVDDSAF